MIDESISFHFFSFSQAGFSNVYLRCVWSGINIFCNIFRNIFRIIYKGMINYDIYSFPRLLNT